MKTIRWNQARQVTGLGLALALLVVIAGCQTTVSLGGTAQVASAPQVTSVVQLGTLIGGKTGWGIWQTANCQAQVVAAKDMSLQFSAEVPLKGDPGGDSNYCALTKDLKNLNLADIIAFRMRVKSDNVTGILCQLVDGTGQLHQTKKISITADGQWHDLVIKPAEVAGGEHWTGANDGKWHGKPIGIIIILNYSSDSVNHKPVLYLTEICADAVKK
jgi:hypothetical protein